GGNVTIGKASSADGALVISRAANAFTTTIKAGVTGASYTLTLPVDDGAANEVLSTDGSGALSWAASGSPIYSADGTLTGARELSTGANVLQFDIDGGGTFQVSDAGVNILKIRESGQLVIGDTGGLDGSVGLVEAGSGFQIGLIPPPVLAASYSLTLPVDGGTANQVLSTDGTGVLSWTSAGSSLYSTDGTLTAARTIATGGNALTIDGTGDIVFSDAGTITLGTLGAASGSMVLNSLSGRGVTVAPSASQTSTYTITLPVDDGLTGEVLINSDGAGTLAWGAAGGAFTDAGLTVYTPTITDDVGIGITAPTSKLHIVEQADATTAAYIYQQSCGFIACLGGSTALGIQTAQNATVNDKWINFYDSAGGTDGSISANGAGGTAYNTTSDERLKENIVDSQFGLDKVLALQVRDYNFIEYPDMQQTGFIAQELYEVYPNIVAVGGDDEDARPWMVDYSKLTPLLAAAIQDLNVKVDAIKKPNLTVTVADHTFEGSITVAGHVNFGADTVGQAQILEGDEQINVEFEQTYDHMPVVTVTPRGPVNGDYWVENESISGFTIMLSRDQDDDLSFNWHAFGTSNLVVQVSDGTNTSSTPEEPTTPVDEEVIIEEEPVIEEPAIEEEVIVEETPEATEEATPVEEEIITEEEPVIEEPAIEEEVIVEETPEVIEEVAPVEEEIVTEEPVIEEEVVEEVVDTPEEVSGPVGEGAV
ncbi:MAG: hypothetical protein ACI83D_000536, partial [Planctomycetota bacterium]